MDRWGILWIECFAIVASYLILTMPAASATSARIYSSSNPDSPLATVTYSPDSFVDRSVVINPPWSAPVVSVGVSNSSTGVSLERVLVYRCRNKDPVACASGVQPDSSDGNFESGFAWTSMAGQTTSYPQKGSLLVMARVNSGGVLFWTGFWIVIERASEQGFSVSQEDLSSISIYVDDIGQVNLIKSFISINHMIPVNPDWMSRIVFSSAVSMYEIAFNEPGDYEGQPLSGNEVYDISMNYSLILPVVSTQALSPLVLYRSPPYICGNSQCEGESGESSGNCCLDCPCGSGYYCDLSKGCQAESGIEIAVYGSFQPGVSNCYESHALIVPVEVRNAPSGMSAISAWYMLMGSQYPTACVHVSGSLYSCPITVPAMPDCTEGVYMLGPNRIGMSISYPDGGITRNKMLETGLPYITIGSFSCGGGGCERSIGESEQSCCYDCGCTSGYCDYWSGGSPIDAACRQDPDGDDIYAASVSPSHFSGFSAPGETVNINIVVGNAPGSLAVTQDACTMGCFRGTEACSASCSISCSGVSSSDPRKYNSTCTLSVSIADYDSGYDYVLSPEVTFGFRYSNGSSLVVTRSVTKILNSISVGAHWCGDGACTGEENSVSCCYDCPCPSGQYCDTKNINGPTQGDACKAVSGAGLVIDSIGSLVLEDSMQEHIIPIEGHMSDAPSGLSVSGTCSLAGDPGIECLMYCQATGKTESGTGVMCELHVPPIDYVTEGQPYYDPGSRKLTLSQSSYEITVSYNNGGVKREDVYEEVLGTVEISVISHCGEGGCEVSLGENQATCCRDCGCSDYGSSYFCYTGRRLAGECMDNSSILLDITGFEPSPAACIIGYMGGPCRFLGPVEAEMEVMNAPQDVAVVDASYVVGGQDAESMECEEGNSHGEFLCPILPEDLEGSEGAENRSIEIITGLSYTIDGVEVLQEASANTTLAISRKKSDALISCDNEVKRLQEQADRLESNSGSYDTYSLVMYIIAAILMAVFIYCIICSCSLFGVCVTEVSVTAQQEGGLPDGPSVSLAGDGEVSYAACGTSCMSLMTSAMQMFMFASSLGGDSDNAEMQRQSIMQEMETKKQMCSAESFGELAGATGTITSLPAF